jgi:hypothetical protein
MSSGLNSLWKLPKNLIINQEHMYLRSIQK